MAVKRNPRPIPLDHVRLEKVAEGLARTAHRNLTNWQQLDPNGMVLAQNVMKVTNVKGEERYITILLITKPRENWMDETSGSFSKKGGQILIKIPVGPDDLKMLLDTLADPGVESGLHILRTLQHEMTHARDHYHLPKGNWELSSSKETVGKYLNMPVEVRARMQELAQLAVASIPAIKREYRRPKPPEIPPVQWVLEQMELWYRAEPLYTPKSRKQIMLGVERALRDAGLDMEGRGALRNPRLVPLQDKMLQELVGKLRTKLIAWVRATSTAVHKPELMLSIDIEMVQAGRSVTREYRIVMVGAPATNTKRRFVRAGSYGDGLIQIDVMIDRVRSAFTEGGEDSTGYVKLRDELTEILAHEMTHAGEYQLTGYKFMKRPDGSVPFVKWANDPAEVRAEARLIWEQIRQDLFDWQLPIYQEQREAGTTSKGVVEYMLEQSPEWKRLDKALTPSNRAKIIKLIERELREAGVDTEGKGSLRNPAPVPIDRPELRAFARALARRLAVRIPSFPSLKPGDILAEEWITVPRIGTAAPAKVSVLVEAGKDEKPETRFTPYVVGGRFNAQRDRILIWLDIAPIVRDFGARASSAVKHDSLIILEKDLLHMLAHEMTHATERSLPKIKAVTEEEMTEEELLEWGNRRHEVRAQASVFVEEILGFPKWRLETREKYLRSNPKRPWVEWLILQTQSHFNYDRLTEKNKRQVLLIVERALRDAGVETQGEGALRNPTPPAKQLERKGNGAYKTAFFGDDDGSWQAFGNNQWPSLRDWDWQMIPSMSLKNDWKNFSVDGATEQHTGFIRALRQISEQYPEVLDFVVSFDGPCMPIRDLLAAWAEAPVPIGAMTFFHGTSGAAWESIMREGMRPRGETGQTAAYGAVIDQEKAGRADAVYLTTQSTMARSAARQAARAHKSFPVVLKVTGLDPSLAEPDEDSREKTAEASIARMGSMAYRGSIKPDQIGLEWAGDEVKGSSAS